MSPILEQLPHRPELGVDAARVQHWAQRTFEIEAQALLALARQPAEPLVQAVRLILGCRGRTVVMGMGKSGHVGRKVAATLASTGTPAHFVHPAEIGRAHV